MIKRRNVLAKEESIEQTSCHQATILPRMSWKCYCKKNTKIVFMKAKRLYWKLLSFWVTAFSSLSDRSSVWNDVSLLLLWDDGHKGSIKWHTKTTTKRNQITPERVRMTTKRSRITTGRSKMKIKHNKRWISTRKQHIANY